MLSIGTWPYDLASTHFEGSHCPLGKLGHSRDDHKGKLQVVFGLMANAEGCPVAVEVPPPALVSPLVLAGVADGRTHR